MPELRTRIRERLRTWWLRRRGEYGFACNVCGRANRAGVGLGREVASCDLCHSTVRVRSIIHVLSTALFGRSLAIRDFPRDRSLRGLGMSDWSGYADRLAQRLDYRNTFFEKEPRLDIRAPDPSLFGTLDFLISTEVFEHVAPPVQDAFDNACRLLKPAGVFVFTVPYAIEGHTVEHFPELHDYRLERAGRGFVLRNRTRDGREQVFDDLVFHGGIGETLELRVFALGDLRAHCRAAGFESVRVHDEDVASCGVTWEDPWSVTISARRGR